MSAFKILFETTKFVFVSRLNCNHLSCMQVDLRKIMVSSNSNEYHS